MKELKNNVNTLLWLMVTLSVMMMFLTLSSCNSSVNSNGKGGKTPNPGPETVKITVIAPKEGGSIKVNGKVLEKTKEFTPKVGDTMTFEAVPDVDYYAEWNTVSGLVINEDDPKIASLTVASDSTIDLNSSNPMKKVDFEFIKKYISFNKDSDIVYDINGMGFGRRAKEGVNSSSTDKLGETDPGKNNDGKLYYLTYGYNPTKQDYDRNYGRKTWTSDEIISSLTKWNPPAANKVTNIAEFSIHAALEARWLSTYNTKYFYPNEDNWLSKPGYSGDPDKVKRMCNFMNIGYFYAVKYNEKERAVYTLCTRSQTTYFADWQFVFVQKDKSEGYTFHFGPYFLRNANSSRYEYAPGLSEDNQNKDKNIYECKMSAMFEDYLKKDKKINLSENKIKDLVSDFETQFYKNTIGCDVYIVHRRINKELDNYSPNFVWSSVFKLNADDYWQECFKE